MNKAVWHCPICHEEGIDPAVTFCPKDGCAVDLVANRENEWVGRIIGHKYRIVQFLGAGGMADVFEVEQISSKKRYALKLLKPAFARDAELNQRFRQEARLIALIAHPNIVELLDSGLTEDGLNYMVMELLSGCSLEDAIRNEPLEPALAFQIALLVCEGIAAAHERGVIHRDLKPDNVFLHSKENGESIDIKILDLGIGKLFNSSVPTGITLSGAIVGTPQYMSPEQCMGKACSISSDIYSMGIILYQMLFGVVPFKDDSPLLVLPRHINEEPKWNQRTANRLDIPKEAKDVVLKALSKTPEARHETMLDLQKDISLLLRKMRQGTRLSLQSSADVISRHSVSPLATSPTIAVAMGGSGISVVNNDEDEQYMAIEFAADTYWVGRRHKSRIECNPYLRIFRSKGQVVSVLVNTGPLRDLNVLTQKVSSTVGSFEGINYVFLTHADPDVAGSIAEIQRMNPRIVVICSQDTWYLIRHQGIDPRRYMPIESLSTHQHVLNTGHVLQFLPVPYCPTRGAMMLFDKASSVLFSGGLCSSFAVRNGFIYTRQDESGIRKFHQSRMPSSEAISMALQKVRQLDGVPRLIAPHYGNIISDENVQEVLDVLSKMRVGMELMMFNESRSDAIALANGIAKIFAEVAGKEGATALLNRFSNDRKLNGMIDVHVGNIITGFRIEYTDAIETLIRTAEDELPINLAEQFTHELSPLREQLTSMMSHDIGG